jgi:hypothetical protein
MFSYFIHVYRCAGLAVTIVLLFHLPAASAQALGSHWRPGPMELKQLPEYCQGQFVAELASVPSKNISNCGGRMNHFCPGLVLINRVSDFSRPKVIRQQMLAAAKGDINYTLSAITPHCPILQDVMVAQRRVQILESVLK